MNNSLIINFEILKKLNITLDEFLVLYKLYKTNIQVDDELFQSLENKQFIKIIKDDIIIRQKGKDLIDACETNSKVELSKKETVLKRSSRKVNSIVEDRIIEYRDKWKGLKPGSRGSLASCRDKLTKWMKENPDYNFDQILKAADLYLNTEGKKNLTYLQRADYFISKVEKGIEVSRLSAYIDEIDDYQEEGWTNELR